MSESTNKNDKTTNGTTTAAPVDPVAPRIIDEKEAPEHDSNYSSDSLDIYTLHEAHAGRLVVDPEEARVEFGGWHLRFCHRYINLLHI